MTKHEEKNVVKKRKQSHMLTYLGFGVLMVTFVAKDAIRDELKDAVASLESAENMFVITSGIDFTDSNVAELTRSLAQLSEESHKSKRDTEWLEERRDDALHEVQLSLVGLAKRLNNVEALTGRAPHRQDEKDLTDFKLTLNEMYGKWDAAYKAQDATPQRILEVDNIGLAAAALGLDISHFEGRVLEHAKVWKDFREAQFKWATWASWFLYPLGVVIALVGKLRGEEGMGAEE
jgi:hypothetical protein